jgi:hypothetical protein
MSNLNTDNIVMLAVLALDVRPSSICITKSSPTKFEIQVLRHEVIGRPFDFFVQRFGGILTERFKGTLLQDVQFEIKIVDALTYKFEEQRAWKLATSPITVAP